MIKLFGISLIIIGSFLEIWYYQYRFSNDGISIWLSVVIGTALTLFLCLAILNRDKKNIKILILTLIIYSVLATSAGQSFSLSLFQETEHQEDIQEKYRQEEIIETQNRIQEINLKYSQIQNAIEQTIETLHDRGAYRTALEKAETEQRLLNEERTELKNQLSELRSEAITYEGIEDHKTNIYEFYNRLTFISEEWLQFIFQTWLSIFIAIMAPLGITTLQGLPKKEKSVKKPYEEKRDNLLIKMIEKWVYINWFGIRSKKSNRILSKKTFFEYSKSHGLEYPKRQYDKIKNIAIKNESINNKGEILNENESEVVGKIINYVSTRS